MEKVNSNQGERQKRNPPKRTTQKVENAKRVLTCMTRKGTGIAINDHSLIVGVNGASIYLNLNARVLMLEDAELGIKEEFNLC